MVYYGVMDALIHMSGLDVVNNVIIKGMMPIMFNILPLIS